jgi:hypothetical protein
VAFVRQSFEVDPYVRQAKRWSTLELANWICRSGFCYHKNHCIKPQKRWDGRSPRSVSAGEDTESHHQGLHPTPAGEGPTRPLVYYLSVCWCLLE